MNTFRKKFIKILREGGPLADLSGAPPAGADPATPAAPGELPPGNINVQDPSLQNSIDKTAEAGNTPDPIMDGLPQWTETAQQLQKTALELLNQVKVASGKPGAGKIWGRAASLLSDIRSKLAALGSELESAGVTYGATKVELAKQGQ